MSMIRIFGKLIKKIFPNAILYKRSIVDIGSNEIPNAIGLIGDSPCQSWS